MKRFFLVLFFLSCFASATFTLFYYSFTVPIKGENSTGEAGKVYFAHKFQTGGDFLESGKTPPYYPAVHGILLHASVGLIGRLFSSHIEDLYYIGRSITAAAAVVSLLLVLLICHKLTINLKWSLLSLILFLAPFPLHQFASSYRPDHWILCLSLLSCFLCLNRPKSFAFCILIGMPTLAFLIKATGIIIAASIFISFLIRKHYKSAFSYAFCSSALFITTLFFLNLITHGLFVSSFLGGMKIGFSIYNTLQSFNNSAIWFPILMPPFIIITLNCLGKIPKERLLIVFLFWNVETVAAALSATRYGSNVYYFLNAYTYGTIIFIYWLHTIYEQLKNKIYLRPRLEIIFIILFVSSICILVPFDKALRFPILDSAIVNTLYFAKERRHLAAWVNKYNLKCYSDDPNLNILLRKPLILYPLLQNTFFNSGYLDKNFFLEQIRKKEFDLIVLTGHPWSHQGINKFPEEFMPLVSTYYKPLKIYPDSGYLILVPKSESEEINN